MKNGTCWTDDRGEPIQAHGGMITRFGDRWYWYGENKNADNCVRAGKSLTRVDVIGISCYSSPNLTDWHWEGLALASVPGDASHPLHPSRVCERPKVFYHAGNRQYIMWFHADSADYTFAQAGCAVADRPEGPFRFLYTKLPNRRDCRDMTLYRNAEDGRMYLVHSGDWNKTMYFSQLTEDGLDFTGVCHAAMMDQEREAPALFWQDGLHYCITSGCTGWQPNSALYATAAHLSSGMKLIDNPCEGPDARNTFGGQCTWVFEANGRRYLMLDHWLPLDLKHSGYSILPLSVEQGRLTVRWEDTFQP